MFKGFLFVVSALTLFGAGAVFEHKYGTTSFEVFADQVARFLPSFEGRTEPQSVVAQPSAEIEEVEEVEASDDTPAPAQPSAVVEEVEEVEASDDTPAPAQPSAVVEEVEEVEASDDTPAQPSAVVEEVEASDDTPAPAQPSAVVEEVEEVEASDDTPAPAQPSAVVEEVEASDDTPAPAQPSAVVEEVEEVEASDDTPAPAQPSAVVEEVEEVEASDDTPAPAQPSAVVEEVEEVEASDDTPAPAQPSAVVEEMGGDFGVSLEDIMETAAADGNEAVDLDELLPDHAIKEQAAKEVIHEDLTPLLPVVDDPTVVVDDASGVEDINPEEDTKLDILPEYHQPIRVEVTFVDEAQEPVVIDYSLLEDGDEPEEIADPAVEDEPDQVIPVENLAQADVLSLENACERLRTLNHRAYLRDRAYNTRTQSFRYRPVIWCRYNARLALRLAESDSSFGEISLSDGRSVSRDECVRNLAAHDAPSDLSRACTALWKGNQEIAPILVRDLSMLVPGVR